MFESPRADLRIFRSAICTPNPQGALFSTSSRSIYSAPLVIAQIVQFLLPFGFTADFLRRTFSLAPQSYIARLGLELIGSLLPLLVVVPFETITTRLALAPKSSPLASSSEHDHAIKLSPWHAYLELFQVWPAYFLPTVLASLLALRSDVQLPSST